MEEILEQNNLEQKRQFPFFTVLLCLFLVVLIVLSFIPQSDDRKITQQEFDTAFTNEQVAGVYFYGDTVYGVYKTDVEGNDYTLAQFQENYGKNYDFYFTVNVSDDIATLKETIRTYNIANPDSTVWYDGAQASESWFNQILPFLYIGLVIIFAIFVFRAFNKMSGKNMDFGKNKARVETNLKVRFSDVAGCEEEKKEMSEIVEFLKNPKKFTDLGARIPKGVLLIGPPGTGKTLLGKAIAGEAGVPFFSITGSDFVEMFVGVGAARVRDLFNTAKKASPCLIFIDEIDAVGRQRGTGLGNTNDEREQTLNQLLVQMDGFESSEGIIVLAATNRPDVLDPALLRAGRFDRRITVGYPDVNAREKILKLYTKDKPMAKNINYNAIARHLGPGTTGADIENIVNEAAIMAARGERSIIMQKDIMEGIVKVAMGPQRRSRIVSDEDKKNTAYHESGHAIVIRTSKNYKQDVQEVSIIPRGIAGGYTAPSSEKDLQQHTKEQILDQITMAMGGRAAELIIYNQYGTGALGDIKEATRLARQMVTEFGMSDKLGSVSYSGDGEVFLGRDFQAHNNFSEKTAELIDSEVKSIIEKCLKDAIEILKKHRAEIEVMVEVLLEKETIYAPEVDMIVAGKSAKEVIKAINKCEAERSKEDEEAREEKVKKEQEKHKAEEERIRLLKEKALLAFNGQQEIKLEKTEKVEQENKAEKTEQVEQDKNTNKDIKNNKDSKSKENKADKVNKDIKKSALNKDSKSAEKKKTSAKPKGTSEANTLPEAKTQKDKISKSTVTKSTSKTSKKADKSKTSPKEE